MLKTVLAALAGPAPSVETTLASDPAVRLREGRSEDSSAGLLARIARHGLTETDAAALAQAVAAGGSAIAHRVVALVRHYAVRLTAVDRVADSISLDEMLPRLIALLTDTLGAERAALFLVDEETGELFSRVATGTGVGEIRMALGSGIAGAVVASGRSEIVPDAYADPRFNVAVDRQTGFVTRTLIAAPVRTAEGRVIGVTEVLNKCAGAFDAADLEALEVIAAQVAAALENGRRYDRLRREHHDHAEVAELAGAIASELQIDRLLARIMSAATQLLGAERSSLFVHDPKTGELWSRVAEGMEMREIRIPQDAGIAGAAFVADDVLNIPDAYADPRFNPAVDYESGFRTRSILAAPIHDRVGQTLGVIEVLNKRDGAFSAHDQSRLRAFAGQVAIALQNAQLFEEVLNFKNSHESVLKSVSNGIITFDAAGQLAKVNEAARRILRLKPDAMLSGTARQLFGARNPLLARALDFVARTGGEDYHADIELACADGSATSVNLTAAPMRDASGRAAGAMLVFEDITGEKRVRGTMARYMAKEVADHVLAGGAAASDAKLATVLFSDIRRFTSLTEALSPHETVQMLNEYFTAMADVVMAHGGILDKYIGDAIMAVFGAPTTRPDDADSAVLVAEEMIRALRRLNLGRAARGLIPIEIGVGLATGEVLAGSIGSARRLDYTVIGDSVNLAARIESATKHYGASVLLAGETVAHLREPKLMRRLDLIRVKGKTQTTELYESLGHHTDATFPHLTRVIYLFERGVDAYRARAWRLAQGRFAAALEFAPADLPSQVYVNRCRFYVENPPPEDWDGVWSMTDK